MCMAPAGIIIELAGSGFEIGDSGNRFHESRIPAPYGCTTLIESTGLRPMPRISGRYMSSTSGGGTR